MLDALCQNLPSFLHRFCGPLRMVVWGLAVSLLFYLIGRIAAPALLPGMCLIYG